MPSREQPLSSRYTRVRPTGSVPDHVNAADGLSIPPSAAETGSLSLPRRLRVGGVVQYRGGQWRRGAGAVLVGGWSFTTANGC